MISERTTYLLRVRVRLRRLLALVLRERLRDFFFVFGLRDFVLRFGFFVNLRDLLFPLRVESFFLVLVVNVLRRRPLPFCARMCASRSASRCGGT